MNPKNADKRPKWWKTNGETNAASADQSKKSQEIQLINKSWGASGQAFDDEDTDNENDENQESPFNEDNKNDENLPVEKITSCQAESMLKMALESRKQDTTIYLTQKLLCWTPVLPPIALATLWV